jgi:hypothetical protein
MKLGLPRIARESWLIWRHDKAYRNVCSCEASHHQLSNFVYDSNLPEIPHISDTPVIRIFVIVSCVSLPFKTCAWPGCCRMVAVCALAWEWTTVGRLL